ADRNTPRVERRGPETPPGGTILRHFVPHQRKPMPRSPSPAVPLPRPAATRPEPGATQTAVVVGLAVGGHEEGRAGAPPVSRPPGRSGCLEGRLDAHRRPC